MEIHIYVKNIYIYIYNKPGGDSDEEALWAAFCSQALSLNCLRPTSLKANELDHVFEPTDPLHQLLRGNAKLMVADFAQSKAKTAQLTKFLIDIQGMKPEDMAVVLQQRGLAINGKGKDAQLARKAKRETDKQNRIQAKKDRIEAKKQRKIARLEERQRRREERREARKHMKIGLKFSLGKKRTNNAQATTTTGEGEGGDEHEGGEVALDDDDYNDSEDEIHTSSEEEEEEEGEAQGDVGKEEEDHGEEEEVEEHEEEEEIDAEKEHEMQTAATMQAREALDALSNENEFATKKKRFAKLLKGNSNSGESLFSYGIFSSIIRDHNNTLVDPSCDTIYHDMNRPLNQYWIASSHNT
jgi:hypothetical protein